MTIALDVLGCLLLAGMFAALLVVHPLLAAAVGCGMAGLGCLALAATRTRAGVSRETEAAQ